MARIDEYLRKILSSRYGRDVRNAIHDSIEEINNINEANISTVQAIADTAQGYANNASASATTAQEQATLAQQQATLATTQAENANDSAEDSEAWAVGKRGGVDVPSTDDTYQNNAKYWQERANYWYQQAQAIAESFSGALRPMGTVAFENLPPIAEAEAGDMYNVSDEFTTTSDFKEGAGHRIPLGSNVYKTNDGKWDVLAGSPVTGIKGDSESAYRKGNVNITKANIGLGNVDNESLGSADISAIGDGSVKGAISSLNSDLAIHYNTKITINNGDWNGDVYLLNYIPTWGVKFLLNAIPSVARVTINNVEYIVCVCKIVYNGFKVLLVNSSTNTVVPYTPSYQAEISFNLYYSIPNYINDNPS